MASRNNYFDFLRGIAILMVVGIHTFNADGAGLIFDIKVLIRQLLNCAVPIFLAISGYFLSIKHKTKEYKLFLYKQIPKVYVPCIIWSLPYFILFILNGGNILKGVLMLLVCGYSIYYFIALIMQYYILLPVLEKVNGGGGLLVASIVSIVTIGSLTYISSIQGLNIPLILFAGPFPVWIVFFVLGIRLGKINRDYNITVWIFVIIIGILLSYIESSILYSIHNKGLGIKISSFIYAFAIIMTLFSTKLETKYKHKGIAKTISYVGSISFGMYLIHCFFISFLRYLYPDFCWILLFCLTTLLTVLTIYIARKIMPSSILKLLGF